MPGLNITHIVKGQTTYVYHNLSKLFSMKYLWSVPYKISISSCYSYIYSLSRYKRFLNFQIIEVGQPWLLFRISNPNEWTCHILQTKHITTARYQTVHMIVPIMSFSSPIWASIYSAIRCLVVHKSLCYLDTISTLTYNRHVIYSVHKYTYTVKSLIWDAPL